METVSEIERRRLIAILGEDRELFALSCAKIFTAGRDGGNWLDSNLEGFLCFVIDQNDKSKYFYLYDTSTYDKLIQIELYQDFNRYYTVLCNNFHCFEMNYGFIGFRFEKVSEARKFGETVIKLDDDKIVFNRKDKSKKTNEIFEIIKKNISNKLSKTNAVIKPEFHGDDGIDICKPNHFSLLNTISFDNNKQRFVISDIPRDLKNLFKSIGLKKSDLKDTSYALNIFKILIQAFETLQNEKKEKTINLCKVKGKYLAEKEVKKTDKPKGKTSFLSENRPNISNLVSKPEDKNSTISNVPSIPSVPKVPAVPSVPKVPAVPKVPSVPLNPTVNNHNSSQNIQTKESTPKVEVQNTVSNDKTNPPKSNTGGNLQEEVGKVVLKPVAQKQIKINQNDQAFIKNVNPLQLAIQQRREKLTKNDVNSDESDNEWSDDD